MRRKGAAIIHVWLYTVTDLLWIFLQRMFRMKLPATTSCLLVVLTGFSVLMASVDGAVGIGFAFTPMQSCWPHSVGNAQMPVSPRYGRQMRIPWVLRVTVTASCKPSGIYMPSACKMFKGCHKDISFSQLVSHLGGDKQGKYRSG